MIDVGPTTPVPTDALCAYCTVLELNTLEDEYFIRYKTNTPSYLTHNHTFTGQRDREILEALSGVGT